MALAAASPLPLPPHAFPQPAWARAPLCFPIGTTIRARGLVSLRPSANTANAFPPLSLHFPKRERGDHSGLSDNHSRTVSDFTVLPCPRITLLFLISHGSLISDLTVLGVETFLPISFNPCAWLPALSHTACPGSAHAFNFLMRNASATPEHLPSFCGLEEGAVEQSWDATEHCVSKVVTFSIAAFKQCGPATRNNSGQMLHETKLQSNHHFLF